LKDSNGDFEVLEFEDYTDVTKDFLPDLFKGK